jgi:hypothetical protein
VCIKVTKRTKNTKTRKGGMLCKSKRMRRLMVVQPPKLRKLHGAKE